MANYFDEIDRFKDYKVSIIHAPSGSQIFGILASPTVSFSSGANYEANPINEAINGGIEGAVQGGAKALGGDKLASAAGAIMQASITHSSTVKTFRGSTDGAFNLTFKVFLGKFGAPASYSAVEKVIQFLTCPKIVANQLNSNLYTPEEAKAVISDQGRVTALDGKLIKVIIGEWFETQSTLYITNVDRNYSTFTDINGSPLYLELTVGFVSYRAMLSDDHAWIKK